MTMTAVPVTKTAEWTPVLMTAQGTVPVTTTTAEQEPVKQGGQVFLHLMATEEMTATTVGSVPAMIHVKIFDEETPVRMTDNETPVMMTGEGTPVTTAEKTLVTTAERVCWKDAAWMNSHQKK